MSGGVVVRHGWVSGVFGEAAGFRSCYLTTFAGLDPARRLYEGAGFVLIGEDKAESWGTRVVQQRLTLDLAARRYR